LFGYYNNEVLEKRDSEGEDMDGIYSSSEDIRKNTEVEAGKLNGTHHYTSQLSTRDPKVDPLLPFASRG
jgi:hypothetical protein